MGFSTRVVKPLYYDFKVEINADNIQKFVRAFSRNELNFHVFTEDFPEEDYSVNDKAKKMTRGTFRDFFYNNLDKDQSILFYDSTC